MEAHYLTAACATVNIFVFSLLLVAMDFQGRRLIFIPSTLLPFINSGKTTELFYRATVCDDRVCLSSRERGPWGDRGCY